MTSHLLICRKYFEIRDGSDYMFLIAIHIGFHNDDDDQRFKLFLKYAQLLLIYSKGLRSQKPRAIWENHRFAVKKSNKHSDLLNDITVIKYRKMGMIKHRYKGCDVKNHRVVGFWILKIVNLPIYPLPSHPFLPFLTLPR